MSSSARWCWSTSARQLTGQAVLVGELLKQRPRQGPGETGGRRGLRHAHRPALPRRAEHLRRRGPAAGEQRSARAAGTAIPRYARGCRRGARRRGVRPRVRYSRDPRAEVVEVLVPSSETTGGRSPSSGITDHLSTAAERFAQLRILIASACWPSGCCRRGPRPDPRAHGGAPAAPPDARRGVVRTARAGPAGPGSGAGRKRCGCWRGRSRACSSASTASKRTAATCSPTSSTSWAGRWARCARPTAALLDGAGEDPELRSDLLKGIDGEISRMEVLLDELSGLRDLAAGPRAAAPAGRRAVRVARATAGAVARGGAGGGASWTAEIPARPADGRHRPGPAGPGARQPVEQRDQVHPAARRGARDGLAGETGMAVPGGRHRPRHPGGRAGAHFRAVLPHPARAALPAGARAGAAHRPRPGAGARRRGLSRQLRGGPARASPCGCRWPPRHPPPSPGETPSEGAMP